MALRDFYGSLGLTESQGECSIVYNGTQITLPDLGHSVDIQAGLARFQQFSVLGAHLVQHLKGLRARVLGRGYPWLGMPRSAGNVLPGMYAAEGCCACSIWWLLPCNRRPSLVSDKVRAGDSRAARAALLPAVLMGAAARGQGLASV